MDPARFKRGLVIPEFLGLASNSVGGPNNPDELTNVYFDRTYGYSPMFCASPQVAGVVRAIEAQNGRNLFVQRASDVAYFNPGGFVLTPIPGTSGATTSSGATSVMPDLAIVEGGAAWLTPAGREPYARAPTLTRDDTQAAPSTAPSPPTVTYAVRNPGAATVYLNEASTYDFLLVFIPTLTAPYTGTAAFSLPINPLGATHYQLFIYTNAQNDAVRPVYNLFARRNGGPYTFVGGNYNSLTGVYIATQQVYDNAGPVGGGSPRVPGGEDVTQYAFDTTTPVVFHQGRVWMAPRSYVTRTYEGQAAITTAITNVPPNRFFYSEVISSAGGSARPQFYLDNYFDLPFRASTRITGFISAGRYLYILGDREAFILTGYNDQTFQIDSLGESGGCTTKLSIQALNGVGYYLSDSGVLAVRAGQVQSVGDPVRDQLLALNPATVTSSVDYVREVYLISDGARTLALSTREEKWSTREVDGTNQRLTFGGGTVYSVHGGNLSALSGEPSATGALPDLLPMTVGWPATELGDWTLRKHWRGLAVGVDADGPGTVENLSEAQDFIGEGDVVQAGEVRHFEAGVRPARFSLGLGRSVAFIPRLRLTPSPGTRTASLRAPLLVLVGDQTEVTF